MQLYLIRHGQTEWNCEKRCQGFTDSELNAAGRRQAEALANRFSGMKVEAIFASTLKRASETARIIARYHAGAVQTSDAFRELNQGEFEGLTLSELFSLHGDFLERWVRDPADLVLPGGESLRAVQERAWAALSEVVEAYPSGNVIVVGHNLCNLALLCRCMNLDLAHFRHLRQDESAVNVIEFGERWPHPVVVSMNDTSHLCNSVSGKGA
jgi:broad specificity phosphatase PhoE